jgi:hydrogenase maturation protease
MGILIAGFGNLLLGDDGFGVEVIRSLTATSLPCHVQAIDVGISGMEMIFRLQEGIDEIIIVDVVRRGQVPGSIYVFTPTEQKESPEKNEVLNPHVAEPAAAMRMAKQLGILPPKVTVVGCEPESCALGIGLSASVRATVNQAVTTILELVDQKGKHSLSLSPPSNRGELESNGGE